MPRALGKIAEREHQPARLPPRGRRSRDAGAPVVQDYRPPFAFSGTIARVVYDVSGERVVDHQAEIRVALARQ